MRVTYRLKQELFYEGLEFENFGNKKSLVIYFSKDGCCQNTASSSMFANQTAKIAMTLLVLNQEPD